MQNNKTFLDALRDEFGIDLTQTENGAMTFKTTNSKLLDLFFKIGALRGEIRINNKTLPDMGTDRLDQIVIDSFKENEDLTLQVILNARDILNGMGERMVPRLMTTALINYISDNLITKDNIEQYEAKFIGLFRGFKELGRWDDLIAIDSGIDINDANLSSFKKYLSNEIYLMVQTQLVKDIANCNANEPISLLAKWLPSENASSKKTRAKAIRLRNRLRHSVDQKPYTSKEYRQLLSKLRKHIKIIENNLREKDYTFDYSKVPSKALAKYSGAFKRNDNERFTKYLDEVREGKAKINTATLTPANVCNKIYNIIHNKVQLKNEELLLNEQWKNMLAEFGGALSQLNAIVAADVSGSMYGYNSEPAIVISIGLALFFAYSNKYGPFAHHFIDFCGESQIHQINPEDSIVRNFEKVAHSSRDMNTNIDSVFESILNAAKINKAEQKDLPKYVIIVSDMEFDQVQNYNPENGKASAVNFKYWKKIFEESGYKLPTLVFWNAESRNDIAPAQKNENVVFISGRSQNGFKILEILETYNIQDPTDLAFMAMLKTIERYNIFFNDEMYSAQYPN